MPIIKSAKKALRQSKRRAKRNLSKKEAIQNNIKIFRKALNAKDAKKTQEILSNLTVALDKAVKSKIIHKNTAARKKSRFAKALAKIK